MEDEGAGVLHYSSKGHLVPMLHLAESLEHPVKSASCIDL